VCKDGSQGLKKQTSTTCDIRKGTNVPSSLGASYDARNLLW